MQNKQDITKEEMLVFIKNFYEKIQGINQTDLEQSINDMKDKIFKNQKSLEELLFQCEQDKDILMETYHNLLKFKEGQNPILECLTNYVGLTKLSVKELKYI